MPYIVLSANGEELERQELRHKPLVIGRSGEADVAVHDILMSRRHCRLEPIRGGCWRVVDLGSKNGTRLGWQRIHEHLLCDGDVLRVGRSCLTFHAGAFVPAPPSALKRGRTVRPADPFEALNGTVSDFVYTEPAEPTPADAEEAGLAAAVGEFAPSPPHRSGEPLESGDEAHCAIHLQTDEAALQALEGATGATAVAEPPRRWARPLPPPPRPMPYRPGTRRPVLVDLSLQASPQHLAPPKPPAAEPVRRLPGRLYRALTGAVRATLQRAGFWALHFSCWTW